MTSPCRPATPAPTAARGGKAVGAIQEEITALSTAINDIATRTEFNGTKLLDDSQRP